MQGAAAAWFPLKGPDAGRTLWDRKTGRGSIDSIALGLKAGFDYGHGIRHVASVAELDRPVRAGRARCGPGPVTKARARPPAYTAACTPSGQLTRSATGITNSSMKTLLLLLLAIGATLAAPRPRPQASQFPRRPSQHVLDSMANAARVRKAKLAAR
jgi:hypothetical protein